MPDADSVNASSWNGQILFHGDDCGDEDIADGYHAKGSYDAWVDAVGNDTGYRRAFLALYVSLSAPLLSSVRAPNYVADWAFSTSTGKTTSLRVCSVLAGATPRRIRLLLRSGVGIQLVSG